MSARELYESDDPDYLLFIEVALERVVENREAIAQEVERRSHRG